MQIAIEENTPVSAWVFGQVRCTGMDKLPHFGILQYLVHVRSIVIRSVKAETNFKKDTDN